MTAPFLQIQRLRKTYDQVVACPPLGVAVIFW